MREKPYLCIMSSNSSNYVVKLRELCRQTIRITETRKIEPKTMKHSYSKSELATMAGVSYSTFYRYLKTRRSRFDKMGLSIYAKKLLFLHSRLTKELSMSLMFLFLLGLAKVKLALLFGFALCFCALFALHLVLLLLKFQGLLRLGTYALRLHLFLGFA